MANLWTKVTSPGRSFFVLVYTLQYKHAPFLALCFGQPGQSTTNVIERYVSSNLQVDKRKQGQSWYA